MKKLCLFLFLCLMCSAQIVKADPLDFLDFDGRKYSPDLRTVAYEINANDISYQVYGYNTNGAYGAVALYFEELVNDLEGVNEITVPVSTFTIPPAEEASLDFIEYSINMANTIASSYAK